jgi:hypothetical protein
MESLESTIGPDHFYDSTRPSAIPDGADACLYRDGDFAASPREALRFNRTRWITIGCDWDNCGIADYEPGNPVYNRSGMLRAWVTGRMGMGRRARVYSDRFNMARAEAELQGLTYEWWIATLDGNELNPDFVPHLWAVQYAGGPAAAVDISRRYGTW